MRRTKMLVTLGPSSFSEQVLKALLDAGVSGGRINFSHSTFEQAENLIDKIRKISRQLSRPFSIRQDLQGPKIRVGSLKYDEIYLNVDNIITLTSECLVGDKEKISVSEPAILEAVSPDTIIIIGDSDIKLKVVEKKANEVQCQVIYAGKLKPKKGISAPGTFLDFKGLTEKDLVDLEFGVNKQVDCISMSFVQDAKDVINLKDRIKKMGAEIPVIAKIEQRTALRDLDNIIDASDGISIARGDLGVEMPLEEIGVLQREIIRRCNSAGKFIFAGSGILEKCRDNPWPSRAEVNDVTSLIMEGIDAISLSDETAVGKYPVETIKTLAKIIDSTEAAMGIGPQDGLEIQGFYRNLQNELSIIPVKSAIIVNTFNRELPIKIAKMHYDSPIIVATEEETIANYLCKIWGVYPIVCPSGVSIEDKLSFALNKARVMGLISNKTSVLKVEELNRVL